MWTSIVVAVATALWACAPEIPGEIDGARLPNRTASGQLPDASADAAADDAANNNNSNNNKPPAKDEDAGKKDGSGGGTTPPPPPPAPTTPCGQLGIDINTLNRTQSVQSCDKRFTLIMQTDGNLVLYQNGAGALWSSNTYGTSGERAVMQGDGNFVLYDAANKAIFHTSTYGHPGAGLAIQNDGNLVIYDKGVPLWASNTSGH